VAPPIGSQFPERLAGRQPGRCAETLRARSAQPAHGACHARISIGVSSGREERGRRAEEGRRKHVSSTGSRLAQHENVRGVLHVVDGAVSRVGAARRPSAEVAVAHHGQALREDSGDPLGRPRPSARWASTPKLPAALHVSSCVCFVTQPHGHFDGPRRPLHWPHSCFFAIGRGLTA
jgi:hypothetical protein